MAALTYRCIAEGGAEYPVSPEGNRLLADGSGTESLMHFYRQGELLKNPELFDPLPGGPNQHRGPHAVVNRSFECSDEAIEAQRQAIWKRHDAELAAADAEAVLRKSKEAPAMMLAREQATVTATAVSEAIKQLAESLKPNAAMPAQDTPPTPQQPVSVVSPATAQAAEVDYTDPNVPLPDERPAGIHHKKWDKILRDREAVAAE